MKFILCILVVLISISLVLTQPTTLYSLSGVSQNSLVSVDLSTGEMSSNKNVYIFNTFLLSMLSSSSDSINYIAQGYKINSILEYSISTGKYTDIGNVTEPTQLNVEVQPYGYDPVNSRVFSVGTPENGFSDSVTVDTYDFGNQQSYSTSLGYSDYSWDSLPTGYYDQYSQNYYVLQKESSSSLTLYEFNPNTQQSNSTSFSVQTSNPYVVCNLGGEVFILDAPDNGNAYSLYLLDFSTQSGKLLLNINSMSYSQGDLIPFSTDNGNYLVILTKSGNGVTYSTVDLTSYQVVSTVSSSSLPSDVSFISVY